MVYYYRLMPYKDPEKRKAYAAAYNKTYMPKWREKHPGYYGLWGSMKRKEDPERFRQYESNRQKTASQRRAEYMANPINRAKDRARRKLRYELRLGRIIKPSHCASCRQLGPTEPDHHNYSKPLEVVWLCHFCHVAITRERRRLGIFL